VLGGTDVVNGFVSVSIRPVSVTLAVVGAADVVGARIVEYVVVGCVDVSFAGEVVAVAELGGAETVKAPGQTDAAVRRAAACCEEGQFLRMPAWREVVRVVSAQMQGVSVGAHLLTRRVCRTAICWEVH